MKTNASHTRVRDSIENLYKRHRVRRLAHGLREFLTIGLGHPKFRSFIAYNCKSIVAVHNILGFLMRLPWMEPTVGVPFEPPGFVSIPDPHPPAR